MAHLLGDSILTNSIFICVPGEPVGKGRPRIGRRGKHAMMFTPQKTADYESLVRSEAEKTMAGRELMHGPVELKLQIFTGIPKSYSKAKAQAAKLGKIAPTKKPDIDNVVKAICDAFNEVVWLDDVQVVDLHVTKRFGEEPCIIAIVTPIEPEAQA